MIQPPWMFPFWEKWSWMNFPKRLELLLYTVLALPNASMMGLETKDRQIKHQIQQIKQPSAGVFLPRSRHFFTFSAALGEARIMYLYLYTVQTVSI